MTKQDAKISHFYFDFDSPMISYDVDDDDHAKDIWCIIIYSKYFVVVGSNPSTVYWMDIFHI